MKSSLAREINRILLLSAIALAAAIALSSLWPLLVALAGYIYWSTSQLFQLYRWLVREDHVEPPDSSGLWGDLYTRLEHLFRKEQKAQAELQAIIARAQSSVNALADGVILIDGDGTLEYFNQSAAQFIGFRADKDIGQQLTNLVRFPPFTAYLQRGDFRDPFDLVSPKDDNLDLQIHVTEFGRGDKLILVRDVTRLHRLEQMRKDFVANVSHELKTPLTVLKGYLETLLDSVPEEQQRLRRSLTQMNQQSLRMEALVHDLLLLSRLENTQSDEAQQAVLVHGLLNRICEDARALSKDKAHTIEVDVPENARVIGNPAELDSAFANLVTNAVKYTPAGGHIQVKWWQDEQGAHMSVTDNGPGIDSRHIPRLTERFYRPDNSRVTDTGGTGLGLAIVKHVLLRHNGKLEIRSAVGKGSTFTCHFPPSRLVNKPTAIAG